MTAKRDNSGCLSLLAIGGVLLLLINVSKCDSSSDTETETSAASNVAAGLVSNAVAAQGPPPVEALNPVEVRKGIAEFKLVNTAEGLSGAMIYSQNCYDSLSRDFSWKKLDRCGAADAAATAATLASDITDLSTEASYFESETSAQRYLAAATGGGESAEAADERLSLLQARLPKPSVAKAEVSASETEAETIDTSEIEASLIVGENQANEVGE